METKDKGHTKRTNLPTNTKVSCSHQLYNDQTCCHWRRH